MNGPDPYNNQSHIVFFVYAGILGIFCVPYFAVMAVAGYQTKKLRGTGWGYTGAALGIVTILGGICNPPMWAGMTFGIWMLVALSKREVQDALLINRGRSV